jgi:diaminopimelate decarboxylase
MLWPLGAHRDSSGELWLGGCAVSRLAGEYGTPLYLFCEDTLRDRARAYRAALQRGYPGSGEIAYAAKAYLNVALAQLVAEEGLGLDVVSGGELYVALRAGFPPGRIHFHGNNKSPAELRQALDDGVSRIVVDNFLELDTLARLAASRTSAPVPIWLRLSTGILAHTHPSVQTGHADTKFGFSIATGDAERAVMTTLQHPELEVVGLHAHIGSQITDPEPLAENARRLVEFAAVLRDRHGFVLRELSPGGGWGVPMTEAGPPAPVEGYVKAVAQAVVQACRAAVLDLPHLVLEPGRSIVAPAGVAVYRVGARKEIPGVRTYVSVDGGMADNIRPALYGAAYTAVAVPRHSPETGPAATETVTIAGKFCESGDILIHDIELPRLEAGALLAVPMAGAYTLAMASNYNLARRPAAVLVKDGGARVMQRRETYDDLVARDVPLRGEGW